MTGAKTVNLSEDTGGSDAARLPARPQLVPMIASSRILDAESMVLAAMLFHAPDAQQRLAGIVTPGHFADDLRRALATEAQRAIAEHGECSPQLIGAKVRDDGDFTGERIADELLTLAEWSMFREAQVWQSVRELGERQTRLTLQSRLRSIASEANGETASNGEVLAAIDELAAQARARSVAATVTMADLCANDPSDEPDEAIETGIHWFDSAMPNGALQRGDKVVIGARPGVGKSALALQLTLGALHWTPDLSAVWGLGEMSERQLRNRALQTLSGLTTGVLRRPWDVLSPLQESAKREAIDALRDTGRRFHILRSPLTPARIEQAIIADGAQWVVLDYLQLIQPDKTGQSRRDEIDCVVRALCRIAQAHGVVMFIISNQAKGTGARDIFSAYKESSEIAFAADLCFAGELIGHDDDEHDLPDVVDVRWRCLKARNGAQQSIVARFDRPAQRFEGVNG